MQCLDCPTTKSDLALAIDKLIEIIIIFSVYIILHVILLPKSRQPCFTLSLTSVSTSLFSRLQYLFCAFHLLIDNLKSHLHCQLRFEDAISM